MGSVICIFTTHECVNEDFSSACIPRWKQYYDYRVVPKIEIAFISMESGTFTVFSTRDLGIEA